MLFFSVLKIFCIVWCDIPNENISNASIPKVVISSVARGGGLASLIGMPTKIQIKKNTTFLAFQRLSFTLK